MWSLHNNCYFLTFYEHTTNFRSLNKRMALAEAPKCFVCFESTDTKCNPLIDVGCSCRGELSRVHLECFHKIIATQQSEVCYVCGTNYDVNGFIRQRQPATIMQVTTRTPRYRECWPCMCIRDGNC